MNAFQYNGRVALALLPCLAVLAGYGGGTVAGILLVGGAATYVLDALRNKEGAFSAAWLTMGLANAGMLFDALIAGEQDRPLVLSILGFGLNALALTLTGEPRLAPARTPKARPCWPVCWFCCSAAACN